MVSMRCCSAAKGKKESAAAAATSPGNGAGTDEATASTRTLAAASTSPGGSGAGAEEEKLRRGSPGWWREKGKGWCRVWAAPEAGGSGERSDGSGCGCG